jgi:hypothetical protein
VADGAGVADAAQRSFRRPQLTWFNDTPVPRQDTLRISIRKGLVMSTIETDFNEATLTKMEIALERACGGLPEDLQGHDTRKFVAGRIIDCAKRGNATLTELTATGKRAVVELLSRPSTETHL